MPRELFPIIQPQPSMTGTDLPFCHDVAWDFALDAPVLEGGEPLMLSGRDAVAVWGYNALLTERSRFEMWTRNYGNDMYNLIGKPFSDELKRAEVTRYLTECLTASPYITDVRNIDAVLIEDELQISCSLVTIYGEVKINV